MPLGRHSVLIYSLGDKNHTENPAEIPGEALILQKEEIVLQLLSSEPKNNSELFEGRSKSFRDISTMK